MIVDCSKCFNKKHYPDSALSIICYRCKEQKMWYYRPDLSDMQGSWSIVAVDNVKPKNQ